jgi:hypothetical protein
VLASIGVILAAPALVRSGFFLVHLAAYDGTCGPHAPDIAAHACDRATYLAEFGAGFAGVGLFIIEAFAALVASIGVASYWAFRRAATDDARV